MGYHLHQPVSVAMILVVCTGNICRSPYAALALQDGLHRRGVSDVVVSSAGTRAVAGHHMAEPMLDILSEQGIRGAAFRSRELDRTLVEDSDLVLTAEAGHRSEVVRLVPRMHSRVFTLRQFARLIRVADKPGGEERDGAARLHDLIPRCAAARGMTQPAGGADDDVADPWRGPTAGYRTTVEMMREPVGIIVNSLAPRH